MDQFIQSPHAIGVTRDSDVTVSDWPVTTRALLADYKKLSAMPEDQVNQPLLALIKARKAIMDARLACQHARRFYKTKESVYSRLLEFSGTLEVMHNAFPLTLLENAKNHPRRHIMAGHDSVDAPTPWGVE